MASLNITNLTEFRDFLDRTGFFTRPEAVLSLFSVEAKKSIQVLCIIFIILSQGGFVFFYSGLSRARNALTPAVAVIVNGCIVFACVWGVGYTFSMRPGNEFIGYKNKWFGSQFDSSDYIPWALHACYTIVVVNIACGGVVERGKPFAYFAISFSLAIFIHPVIVHWAWGDGGWLQTVKLMKNQNVNFRDTGGSCVIHVCGGIVSLVGAIICGPRKERITKTYIRRFQIMHSHSAPMTGFGGIVIYCGLVAVYLSRAVTTNPSDGLDLPAYVIMNLVIGSLGSNCVVFLLSYLLNYMSRHSTHGRFHFPMIQSTVNGILVGLVSVAAGCDVYHSYIALVVGLVGGFVYMFYILMLYLCMIDDPAETFAVHFGPGFWGLLAVAIFSKTHGAAYNTEVSGNDDDTPYLFFAWNLIGGIVIAAWCFGLVFLVFLIVWGMELLRIDKDVEWEGVDADTFGQFAYPIEAWKRAPPEVKVVQEDQDSIISEKTSSAPSICRYCHREVAPSTRYYRDMYRDKYDETKEIQTHELERSGKTSFPVHHGFCPHHPVWVTAPQAKLYRHTPYSCLDRM